tara:strand:+ start:14092 stop:17013 length:2922 start_codon:yes stop_codon:yes gene_type:complete
MFNLEFSRVSNLERNKIWDILTDYKNISKFFPPQLKTKIIEISENNTILEETLNISILKKQVLQKTIHKKINDNLIQIIVLSGPGKGSIINISLETINQKTKIVVHADIKLSLKYFLMYNFIKKKYHVILEMLFNKIDEIGQLTLNEKWNDCIIDDGNCLILSDKNFPKLKFFGWWYSEIGNIFLHEVYNSLPVNDKIVVDIGANISDSASYFIIKGAKHVIAVEPFTINYEMAKKNISINEFDDKITLIRSGISSSSNRITINDTIEHGYTSFRMEEDVSGTTKLTTMTLQEIVEKYKIENGVLKLDCENCEYDAILSSPQHILSKFKNIFVEYHHGYKELKQKLEDTGFIVTLMRNNFDDDIGYLNAQLLEKINYTKSEAPFRCKNCHNFLNFEYFCENCEIQHMDNNGLISYGNAESNNEVNEKKISEIISEINKKDYFKGVRHFLENNPQYQDRFMMNEGDVAFSKIKNFDRCLIINSDLGNISENLSKIFGQVYSIDASKNKLLIQKSRLEANNFKNFFLIHLEKIDFPFPNNYFDLIIVNGKGVEYGIFDDEKNLDYFNKIKQILKPDGCLCVNTKNYRGIGLDNTQKYNDFNQDVFCKNHSDYLKLFRKLDFSTSSSWVFPSHNKPHYLGDLNDKISTKWYLQNFDIFHDIDTKFVFIKYFLKIFSIFGIKNILKFLSPSFIFYCYKQNENHKCLDDTIRKNSEFNHLIQFSRRGNVKFIMIDEFSKPQKIISCNRKAINFDEEITQVNRKFPHMKNPDKDIISEKWFGNKTLDRFNENEIELVLKWLVNFQKTTISEFFDSNSINEEIANLKNELSEVEMMKDLPFELWLQQYHEHISDIKIRKTALHGDFQIKNIIINKNDLSINVIDWGDFLAKGNPLIDFLQLLANILLSDGIENFNKNLIQNSKISPSVKLIKKIMNRHFDYEFDYTILLRFIIMRLVTKRVNNTYMNYVSYVKLLKILNK